MTLDTAMALPKTLLVTPARNAEKHLEGTIQSMLAQTAHPTKWVIINDGSTDKTPEIISRYAAQHKWIEQFDLPSHRDRSFAAKAHCFNAACKHAKWQEYDVVGCLDADITFEPDYLQFLLTKFRDIAELGVAGTPFCEEGGYDSASDSFEGENHVAGGCQMFRRSCFEEVGGYVPNKAGGVDWIAVTTARMKGWQTRNFREKRFFHHRSLGTAERSVLASAFSYGEKDYYLGNSPIWQLFRVAYRVVKPPFALGGIALGLGYSTAAVRRIARPISPELMRFHRREQMAKLRSILKTLVSFKKMDNFTVLKENGEVSKGTAPRA